MQKKVFFYRYVFALTLALFFIICLFFGFFFMVVTSNSSQQLTQFAQRVGEPAFSIVFNYSHNIDNQFKQFEKNIGLKIGYADASAGSFKTETGARGFLTVDAHVEAARIFFAKFNHVLNNLLDFLDVLEESQPEKKWPPFYDPPPLNKISYTSKTILPQNEEALSRPLISLLEEMWNGPSFDVGGVVELQFSLVNSLYVFLNPLIDHLAHKGPNGAQVLLKNYTLQGAPAFLLQFFKKHSVGVTITSTIEPTNSQIKKSLISVFIFNIDDFVDSVCSDKINPWDLCGRFNFNRQKFRTSSKAILSILDSHTVIKLNLYWTIIGNTFVYSNQKSYLENLLTSDIKSDTINKKNNILTAVSSSGYDTLLSTHFPEKKSSISFLFDMIRIQNEALSFVEQMKLQSDVLSDFFASPHGERKLHDIESTINTVTEYSEKACFTIAGDGDKLYPELRLYSPIDDLFVNSGNALKPEIVNSMKIFLTQLISFGNYLLPRGLIPIPGPSVQRNGKWVIIQSEIPVKALAPYLERVDPFLDPQNAPTDL